MEKTKAMTPAELTKYINEMDPNEFALAIFCEKFWTWAKDPDKMVERSVKKLLAKKYNIEENCELMMMMIAFIAGSGAGLEIAIAMGEDGAGQ